MSISVITLSKLLPRFMSDYSLSSLFPIVTTIPEDQCLEFAVRFEKEGNSAAASESNQY